MSPLPHLRPPVIDRVRLTIPARESLARAGNTVRPDGAEHWIVTLTAPPRGLVVVRADVAGDVSLAVRAVEDEPWPHEFAAGWVERGQWVPCPTCGAALLWCEAGFVPGWRICLSRHVSQLSGDGKCAKRHAALRVTKGI